MRPQIEITTKGLRLASNNTLGMSKQIITTCPQKQAMHEQNTSVSDAKTQQHPQDVAEFENLLEMMELERINTHLNQSRIHLACKCWFESTLRINKTQQERLDILIGIRSALRKTHPFQIRETKSSGDSDSNIEIDMEKIIDSVKETIQNLGDLDRQMLENQISTSNFVGQSGAACATLPRDILSEIISHLDVVPKGVNSQFYIEAKKRQIDSHTHIVSAQYLQSLESAYKHLITFTINRAGWRFNLRAIDYIIACYNEVVQDEDPKFGRDFRMAIYSVVNDHYPSLVSDLNELRMQPGFNLKHIFSVGLQLQTEFHQLIDGIHLLWADYPKCYVSSPVYSLSSDFDDCVYIDGAFSVNENGDTDYSTDIDELISKIPCNCIFEYADEHVIDSLQFKFLNSYFRSDSQLQEFCKYREYDQDAPIFQKFMHGLVNQKKMKLEASLFSGQYFKEFGASIMEAISSFKQAFELASYIGSVDIKEEAVKIIERIISVIMFVLTASRIDDFTTMTYLAIGLVTGLGLTTQFADAITKGIIILMKFIMDSCANIKKATQKAIDLLRDKLTQAVLFVGEVKEVKEKSKEEEPILSKEDSGYVFTALFGILGRMFTRRDGETAKYDGAIIRDFRACFGLVKDLKGLTIMVSEAFMVVLKYGYEFVTGLPYDYKGSKNLYELIQKWHAEVDEVVNDIHTPARINNEDEYREKVERLVKESDTIAMAIMGADPRSANYRTFYDLKKEFTSNMNPLIRAAKMNASMDVPPFINLCGPPNTGKSIFANYIVKHIVNKALNKEFNKSMVYQKQPFSEYWANYTGQFAVIMDDMFQDSTSESVTRSAAELIMMTSPVPYYPEQAIAELKGVIAMTSKLLIATTNVRKLPMNANLADRAAFNRRMDVYIELQIKNSFKTKKDGRTIIHGSTQSDINVYQGRLLDPDGNYMSEVMTAPELLEYCLQTYVKAQDRNKAYSDAITLDQIDFIKDEEALKKAKVFKEQKEKIEKSSEYLDRLGADNAWDPTWSQRAEPPPRPRGRPAFRGQSDYEVFAWHKPESKHEAVFYIKKYMERLVNYTSTEVIIENEISSVERDLKFVSLTMDHMWPKSSAVITKLSSWIKYWTGARQWTEMSEEDCTPVRLKEVTSAYEKGALTDDDFIDAVDTIYELSFRRYMRNCLPLIFVAFNNYRVQATVAGHAELQDAVCHMMAYVIGYYDNLEMPRRLIQDQKKDEARLTTLRRVTAVAVGNLTQMLSNLTKYLYSSKLLRLVIAGFITFKSCHYLAGVLFSNKKEKKNKNKKSKLLGEASVGYDESSGVNQFSKKKAANVVAIDRTMRSQGEYNLQPMKDVIAKNLALITLFETQEKTSASWKSKILFTHGSNFISVAHIFTTPWSRFEITTKEGRIICGDKEDLYVASYATRDLSKCTIKKNMEARANIRNQFIKEADLSSIVGADLAILVLEKPSQLTLLQSSKSTLEQRLGYTVEGQKWTSENILRINASTQNGWCGSPYLLTDDRFIRKIAGIHIAGSSSSHEAAGLIVTQEDFDTGFYAQAERSSVTAADINSELIPIAPKISITESENLQILGKLPDNIASRLAKKTSIVSSAIQEHLIAIGRNPPKRPVRLAPFIRDGVRISPASVCVKKYEQKINYFREENIIPFVVDYLDNKLLWNNQVPVTLYSHKIAMNGLQNQDHFAGLKVKKSVGYPDNLRYTSKEVFYERQADESLDFTNLGLEQYVKFEQSLLDVELLHDQVIALDCLKDELVSETKYENGEGRIYSALPWYFQHACRRFLGSFAANIRATSQVGYVAFLSPTSSRQWKDLYNRLNRDGNVRAFDFDHKKMDAKHPKILDEYFIHLVLRFYEKNEEKFEMEGFSFEERQLIRSNLIRTAIGCRHAFGDALYQIFNCNPSGWFLTTELNTIVNVMVYFYSVLRTVELKGVQLDWTTILDHLVFVGLGDDGVNTMPISYTEWFNFQDLYDGYADFGFEITTATKQAITPDMKGKSLADVDFLKRQFRLENGIMYAPLEEATLWNMISWIKKPDNIKEQTVENCERAVEEAYMYGKKFFEEFKQTVNTCLVLADCKPVQITFTSLDRRHKGFANFEGQMDTDRMPNVHTPASNTTLTQNTDLEGISVQTEASPNNGLSPGLNPYTVSDTTALSMKRFYELTPIDWSGNSDFGDTLLDISFPAQYFLIPHLLDMLKHYQYFRCGWEIEGRVNTPKHFSGALMAAWIPCSDQTLESANSFQNVYAASGLNTVILSANSNNTFRITCPYMNPFEWFDLGANYNSGALKGLGGRVIVYVLAPLRTQQGTTVPAVQVNLQMRMTDPQVAGYATRITTPQFNGQSEQIQKSETGLLSGTTMDLAKTSSRWSSVPLVGTYADKAASFLYGTSRFLSKFGLDRPNSLQTVCRTQITLDDGYGPGKGLFQTSLTTFDPAAKVANSSDIYGEVVDYDRIENYKRLPSLLVHKTIDFNQVVGETFINFPVAPTYVATQIQGETQVYYNTHLSNVTKLFTEWEGPLQYCINVYCSGFTTFRYRATLIPDPAYSGDVARTVSGDLISVIVDVSGDTQHRILVPYLAPTAWKTVHHPMEMTDNYLSFPHDCNGQIRIQLVTPIEVADVTASSDVVFAIFVAGASGFRLQGPKDFAYQESTYTGAVQFTGQMEKEEVMESDMRACFRRDFEPIISAQDVFRSGISIGQEVGSFTEYFHRFSSSLPESDAVAFSQAVVHNSGQFAGNWARIVLTFMFNRGGIVNRRLSRLAIVEANDPVTIVGNCNAQEYANNSNGSMNFMLSKGCAVEDWTTKKSVTWTTPFYYKYSMNYMGFDFYLKSTRPGWFVAQGTGVQPAVWLLATQDDFSFGWPRSAPQNSRDVGG